MNTLINGLFYSGDIKHTIINYILLFVTLLPFFVTELKQTKGWKTIFLIALIIQVSFWFTLYAQGISIIWNTMLGILLMSLVRQKIQNKINYIAFGMAIITDLFYAITFPLITTIAHVSAIVLGMLLYLLFNRKTK